MTGIKGLGFHAHKHDPLSTLIKAETRSQYCHGAVLIEAPEWRSKIISQFLSEFPGIDKPGHLIVEEFYPKVRARLLEDDELPEIDVFDVPSHGPDKEAKSVDWMIGQIAARLPYDIPDLFRFLPGVRALIGEAKDDAYKRHQFCSQFRFNVTRMGGTLLLRMHDFNYSPSFMGLSPLEVDVPKLQPISAGSTIQPSTLQPA